MQPCTFLISDYDERWPGYNEGTTWNGFNDVSVTPETLARLKEAFAGDGDPEDWDIPLGENGLVSLAGGFMTVIVRSTKKTEPHYTEDHRLHGRSLEDQQRDLAWEILHSWGCDLSDDQLDELARAFGHAIRCGDCQEIIEPGDTVLHLECEQ